MPKFEVGVNAKKNRYSQHCTPMFKYNPGEIQYFLLCLIIKQSITGNTPIRCLSTIFKRVGPSLSCRFLGYAGN